MSTLLSILGFLLLAGLVLLALGLIFWLYQAVTDKPKNLGVTLSGIGLGLTVLSIIAGVITVGVAEDRRCRELGGIVVSEGQGTNCRAPDGTYIDDRIE